MQTKFEGKIFLWVQLTHENMHILNKYFPNYIGGPSHNFVCKNLRFVAPFAEHDRHSFKIYVNFQEVICISTFRNCSTHYFVSTVEWVNFKVIYALICACYSASSVKLQVSGIQELSKSMASKRDISLDCTIYVCM